MEYRIMGSTMPVVEFTLDKGETVFSQVGSMKWMTSNVKMNTKVKGGLGGVVKRKLIGEGAFLTHFTGESSGATVVFGHTYPGNIVPWDVSQRSVVCQKRAFLCGTEGVELSVYFQKRLGAGFFGGEGFVLQKIKGSGLAFLEIDGEAVEIELHRGETITVETSAVGMFEETVEMNIRRVTGIRNMFFGGEGFFLTTLTGPGKVWLQTMPIQSMVSEMSKYLTRRNKK